MAANERSKQNLKPPFQPGQSGNPAGRTPYERSEKEYRMDLAGKTEAELRKISEDKATPWLKRQLATAMLNAKTDEVPILSIIEQFDGKPAQRLQHEGSVTHQHVRVIERLKK